MKLVFSLILSIFIEIGYAQFENLETTFTKYKIASTKCVGIQHNSGSRIFIPENAFNLKNLNNPDSLVLYYKEYYDSVDFLTNKLDLHYENTFMVSGGMFELYVKLKNEIVPLNFKKEIRVEFIKNNEIPVFDEFSYDEEVKSWDKKTNYTEDEILDDWNANYVNESVDTLWQINPIFLEEEMVIVTSINFQASPLYQTMNISSYGLFNYDYLLKDETAVKIIADFNIKGFNVQPNLIYVVYDELNSLMYYTEEDFRDNFRILPNKEFKIFTVDQNKQIAIWEKPMDFDLEKNRDKKFVFQLQLNNSSFETKQDLKNKIGI